MTAGGGGARDQVARLLTLVPYLHSRGQVGVEDAARVLGISVEQVVRDLKVLFMCGLPGGYPDDLIDVDLDALEDDGVIRVSNADYLARPLRLTAAEATAVMVALLAVRTGAGAETREVVDRALGKLQEATAGHAAVAIAPDAAAESDEAPALRQRLADAARDRRQVRLTYWVPARDEETHRVVDPRAVVSVRGADYLDAWCHSAEDDRMFRIDRIHGAEVLDAPASHAEQPARHLDGGLFEFGDRAERVTLRLGARAAWVVEYYQVESARTLPDGGVEAVLEVADRGWLQRLLLRLAPDARVVSPVELDEALVSRAAESLRLYTDQHVQ